MAKVVQPMVESWVGQKLQPSSVYGVRLYVFCTLAVEIRAVTFKYELLDRACVDRYTQGATLEPHVDRVETHAASAIINIAQSDPAKTWPLRILDHDGNVHDVIMQPGEVLLYESARLQHARPQPLEGEWFANVFVHFHPPGALY